MLVKRERRSQRQNRTVVTCRGRPILIALDRDVWQKLRMDRAVNVGVGFHGGFQQLPSVISAVISRAGVAGEFSPTVISVGFATPVHPI